MIQKNNVKDLITYFLETCTDEQQILFKMVYAENFNLHLPINEVVKNLDEKKILAALIHVENDIKKNQEKALPIFKIQKADEVRI